MNDQAEAGYLGLRECTMELDYKLMAMYGTCVLVLPRSPAAVAGLRSGDYIRSINDRSYEEFHRNPPPAGTPFEIHYWRPKAGERIACGLLGKLPKERQTEWWEKWSATMPGRPVRKDERPVYMDFISKDKRLQHVDFRYLTILLNYDGYCGIFPMRKTIANALECSLSTVSRCQRRCSYRGVLEVVSGKRHRSSNTYLVTWPEDHERSRVEQSLTGNALQVSDQARLLANELLRACGLGRIPKAVEEAPGVVAEWLGRGWDSGTVRVVVREEMEQGRVPSRSLRYFEKAIAKAHGKRRRSASDMP
jgi:hypothetical protein